MEEVVMGCVKDGSQGHQAHRPRPFAAAKKTGHPV
jgi:hypothetical protein